MATTGNILPEGNTSLFTQNNSPIQKTGRGATTLFINEREALNNMLKAGISEKDAREAITKKRKSMLGKVSQQEAKALVNMAADDIDINEAISFVKKRRNDNLPLWKKALKVPFDLSVGATSLAAEQVGNTLDFFTGGKGGFKEQVEGVRDVTSRSFEDSTAFQAGRNIFGAGELFAAAPTRLAPTFSGRVGQGALIGGGVGGAEPILSQGSEATFGDIATGAATGAAFGAAATPLVEKVALPAIAGTIAKSRGLIKRVGEEGITGPITQTVTRDIPESVVRRDLGFTPTERGRIEDILGKTESRYVLEKNLGGKSKEEMAEFFANNTNKQFHDITNKLSTIDEAVESTAAKQALDDMLEQLTSSNKIAQAYADDIAAIESLLAKNTYTAAELNNIRRAFDKINTGLYTAAGKPRSGLDKDIDRAIRQALNDEIENIAEKAGFSVKEMNKELRASIVMKDALLRRMSQEQRNNFLGLQDLGVSAILSGGNPLQAVAIIGAKKGLEDIAPGLAQKAFNINKAKDVKKPSTRRGATVSPDRSTTKLGLTRDTGDNVPSQQQQKATVTKESDGTQTTKTTQPIKQGVIKSKNVKVKDKKQVDKLFESYKQRVQDETGIVIDSDEIKKLFTDFDPKAPEKVHEPSSKLSQIFFEKALEENPAQKVVLTAGGGGSGKSEVLIKDIKAGEPAIVFDGTGKNYDKMISNIEKARAAGKDASIEAVFIDYDIAQKFNQMRERTVPEKLLADTHLGYRKTLLRILKERPDIDITLKRNMGVKDANGNAVAVVIPKDEMIKFLESKQKLEGKVSLQRDSITGAAIVSDEK